MIADLRRKAKLSQRELALRSGVSQAFILGIEKGYRTPSITLSRRIAQAVCASPATELELYRALARHSPEARALNCALESLSLSPEQELAAWRAAANGELGSESPALVTQ